MRPHHEEEPGLLPPFLFGSGDSKIISLLPQFGLRSHRRSWANPNSTTYRLPFQVRQRELPVLNQHWSVWAVTAVVAGISAFSILVIVIGLPGSYIEVSETCSNGNLCVQTTQSGTYLSPTPLAVIPWLLGVVGALGVLKHQAAISWSGISGLLVFCSMTVFSIGLLYLPFALSLLGILAAIRVNRAQGHKVPQGLTSESG